MLGAEQFARRLGVSRSTVYRLRNRGALPDPHIASGRVIRWSSVIVERWIDAGCPIRDEWEKMPGAAMPAAPRAKKGGRRR